MTTSTVYNVFGIKISCAELFRWILDNPDHKWAKFINEIIKEMECPPFKIFVEFMEKKEKSKEEEKTFEDNYCDFNCSVISDLTYKLNKNKFLNVDETFDNYDLKLIGITHDVCEYYNCSGYTDDSIVIGIVTSKINFCGELKHPINPNTKLSEILTFKYEKGFDKAYDNAVLSLKNHPFIKFTKQDLKNYLVQNDCICCS